MLRLVSIFSYTLDSSFSEEFSLHSSSLFQWGVSFIPFELCLVNGFHYTSDTSFNEEFLLHSSARLCSVSSFSYTPDASFSEVFAYTPHDAFREHFPLHSWR